MKTNFRLILLGLLVAFQWHQSSFFALASAKTSGFRSDNTSKSALAPMATFAVVSPTELTLAPEGGSLTVIWDVAGTNAAPISASSVSISLSVDAFPQSYVLLINTPNDGSQVVTLPVGSKSNSAKITVIANGAGIVSAASSVFTIGGNYCFPRGGCISAFGDAPIQSFQITNSTGTSVLFSNSNTGCGIEPGNPAYSNYASTISLRPILARGTSYRLVSTGCAASTCLGAGYGYYIDLNRDGLFNGTGEYIGGTNPATGQVPLNWTVPNTYGEGFYRFRVKSESGRKPLAGEACGGFTNSGEAEDYLVFISNYCAPGYQNSCTQSFINSFAFGSYSNNNTGCANQGSTGNYSLTTISPTQLDNFSYAFSASIGGTLGAAFVGMYIDFNNDFDFSDAGEMVYSSSAKALAHASVINIPQGISGSRRMRVRSSAIESLGLDGSCITRTVGETEDYTIVFGSGIMANGDQPICNGGDPNNITLSTLPPTGSTYQWFSQPGLIAAPLTTAPTAGWTLISGQTSSSFNPISGVTSNITYACRITTTNGESRWVSGVRKVTVLPLVNYGTLASGNQTFSETGDPSLIGFSTAPSGGNGTFAYQWYKADGLVAAPTGTTIPTNWTLISGATSSSYDPPIPYGNTSYAVMVDPTGSQNCGGFTWASGVRQITINNSCLSYCKPDRTGIALNSSLYLSSVTLGGQTQTSGFNNHYGNFGLTNYFTKGTTVSFTLNTTGSTGITRYYAVFADWNRDGDFTDGLAEIVGLSGSSPSSTFSGSITIPTSAVGGRTTIRTYVIAGYNPLSNSCPSLANDLWVGEVEDYCVYISNGLNPGTIAAGNQDLCNGSTPSSMSVSGFSPTTGTSFQWYFRDGIVSAPFSSVGIDGWTLISGATSGTFTPTTPLTSSRSYACRVSSGGSSLWASGVRQITIRAAFNSGTLASGNQTFTGSGDPSNIAFSTAPSGGSGTFAYRWYSRPGIHAAPTGTTIPAEWTFLGITSTSFDPPVQSASISFAAMVDATGSTDCAPFTWANGVRQITINSTSFSPGVLAAGNQTICNGAGPASVLFSTNPTTGSAYQWYFRDGIVAAPANTDPIGVWQILTGQTGSFLTPGATSNSRTYACRVTNGANSQWASGVRQVTVLPPFSPGTLISNLTSCPSNGFDPAPVNMVTNPQGSGQYKWDWFYLDNPTVTCPTVASPTTAPAGWTSITGDVRFSGTSTTGAGILFDATTTPASGRTWVLRITPQANGATPACGITSFTNCNRTIRGTGCRAAVDDLEANNNKMEVGQNIPNPFSDQTSISYFIPSGNGDGQLEVVSINGKVLITELVHEGVRGEVEIRKGSLSPGTYFYRLKTMGSMTRTHKMVVQ